MVLLPLLCITVFITGCEYIHTGSREDCEANYWGVWGLKIHISDAVTKMATGEEAHVVATDGDYVEILTFYSVVDSSEVLFHGSSGREGLYDIHIENPGYHDWDSSGVRVFLSGCTLVAANVYAAMIPE